MPSNRHEAPTSTASAGMVNEVCQLPSDASRDRDVEVGRREVVPALALPDDVDARRAGPRAPQPSPDTTTVPPEVVTAWCDREGRADGRLHELGDRHAAQEPEHHEHLVARPGHGQRRAPARGADRLADDLPVRPDHPHGAAGVEARRRRRGRHRTVRSWLRASFAPRPAVADDDRGRSQPRRRYATHDGRAALHRQRRRPRAVAGGHHRRLVGDLGARARCVRHGEGHVRRARAP